MNPSSIWHMTSKDLRRSLRDRSVLIFGLVVPFALMIVFNLLFSGIGSTEDFDPVAIAIAGVDDPMVAPLGEILAAQLPMTTTVERVGADAARSAVEDEAVDLAVIVPDGFGDAIQSGGSPTVEVLDRGDGSIEVAIAASVVEGYVSQLALASRTAAAAGISGLSGPAIGDLASRVAQAEPLLSAVPGEVADEQLSLQGSLVAGQTALFMFFTVGFGVISLLQERDQGTLPRLQSMPVAPRSIVVAKTLTSFVLGLVSTAVLLGAGSLLFGVRFGAILPIIVVVVATVAAATSLVLVVIRIARTAEQANTMNSILGIGLGVLGGSFFPIGGGGWLARVSDLTPPAALIRGLGITHGGGGVADLAGPLATLGGFLVVAVVLSLLIPDRELRA